MMNALRDEIRAILREELAALRQDAGGPEVETVPIASGTDLTRFARDLMARAADPGFVERVQNGALRFDLARACLAACDAEGAIDALVDLARIDREWQQQKGRKLLLDIFDALGNAHPQTARGRRKLSAVLFS